eukprot:8531277-Pyramimonas_sp.AAC.1
MILHRAAGGARCPAGVPPVSRRCPDHDVDDDDGNDDDGDDDDGNDDDDDVDDDGDDDDDDDDDDVAGWSYRYSCFAVADSRFVFSLSPLIPKE